MDFEVRYEYSPEQQEFRKEVSSWLEANAPKRSLNEDEPDDPQNAEEAATRLAENLQLNRMLGEKGWFAPTVPKDLGGGGLTAQHAVVLNEELGARRLPTGGPGILAPAIMVHGTEEQKQRFVVPWMQGRLHVWEVFTEPEAGSDLASLRTRGVRNGDEWVINGSKQFISGDGRPEWLFTLVNTDPEAPRHENISLFMIKADSPGITIQNMDLIVREFQRPQHFVFFDNVRVPAENLIGEQGKGWSLANTTLELEHGGSGSVGGAPAGGRGSIVNRVIEYLKTA
jgi:acyl-CoA dehydrogenase